MKKHKPVRLSQRLKNQKAITLIEGWQNEPTTLELIEQETRRIVALQEELPHKFNKILMDNWWSLLA